MQLLSFPRVFALLMLLVVLPSAGLSGFGVLAIVNERAAVEKRLEATWTGRLETLSEKLVAALDASHAQLQGSELQIASPDGIALAEAQFAIRGEHLEASNPRLNLALKSGIPDLPLSADRPLFFSLPPHRHPPRHLCARCDSDHGGDPWSAAFPRRRRPAAEGTFGRHLYRRRGGAVRDRAVQARRRGELGGKTDVRDGGGARGGARCEP